MTTAENNTNQQPAEAPLTWTRSKVWGSEGMTHDAAVEINGETWKFRVDSPSKGYWVARAWRDGDFALYREDTTMKGAKAQAQAHANYAATQTCAKDTRVVETYDVQDETVIVLDEGAEALAGTGSLELGPDILKKLDTAEAQQLMAELEETFPHLAEWKRDVLGDQMRHVGEQFGRVVDGMTTMGPALVSAAESVARMATAVERVQAARDRVQLRKDTCGCRTPLHTMRCGVGGRVRVTSSVVPA